MIEYIDLKIDFTNRNAGVGGVTLDGVLTRSYDTAIKFRIEIIGHVLDESYDVKMLTKYSYNQSQALYKTGDNLEFLDGKLIYTPKVELISRADYVRNYLYLSKDGLGLDMAQFNYEVDLSEIDKTALEVKLVYDKSYEVLLAEFEQELEDYKLTLPQADSVRAEIDVILSQFGVDSQAKLNQYDTDAQQAIADNQTSFGLAEIGRQNTYEQVESERNQLSNQAVVDWEQGADTLLDIVEDNESARVDAEATRVEKESERVQAETERIQAEQARKEAETERELAEGVMWEQFEQNELERDKQTSLLNDATGTRLKYWAGSQAEYDAIGTYDLETVYDIW